MWFENFVSKIKHGVPVKELKILEQHALKPEVSKGAESKIHYTTDALLAILKQKGIPESKIMDTLNGRVGPDGERISVIDDTLILPKDRS